MCGLAGCFLFLFVSRLVVFLVFANQLSLAVPCSAHSLLLRFAEQIPIQMRRLRHNAHSVRLRGLAAKSQIGRGQSAECAISFPRATAGHRAFIVRLLIGFVSLAHSLACLVLLVCS